MKLLQSLTAALTCAAILGAAAPSVAQPPGAPPGAPPGRPAGGPKGPGDVRKALQEGKAHQAKSLEALRAGHKQDDDDDNAGKVGQAARRRLNSAIKSRHDEIKDAFGKYKSDTGKVGEERKARFDEQKKWRDEVRAKFKENPDKLGEWVKERGAKLGDRRTEHRETLKKLWGPLHELQPLRAEFRTHAWRMARLERMFVLAIEKKDAKLITRIEKLMDSEQTRHDQRLQALADAVGSDLDGSAPAAAPAPSASAGAAEGDEK